MCVGPPDYIPPLALSSEDVHDIVPHARRAGRDAVTAIYALRGDRVLTAEEEALRDLCFRLLLDADGSDIPLAGHEATDRDRAGYLRYRRELAARHLGRWIAHDSIVDGLVEFLDTVAPVRPAETEPQRVRDEAHLRELSQKASDQAARYQALHALAASGSGASVPAMAGLLTDPQLGGHAWVYLARLVDPHIRARLSTSQRATHRTLWGIGAESPTADLGQLEERLLSWWDEHGEGIRLSRQYAVVYD